MMNDKVKQDEPVEIKVTVSAAVFDALKELAEEQHVSPAEALRLAISRDWFLISKVKEGGKVLVETPNEKRLVQVLTGAEAE